MSIFSSLIPEAHPNHNVFDLSHRDVMSMKSGMITPVFFQHTIPNGTYEIQVLNQIEVSTMAKANFARLKQNFEYYFVPYSQLWRWFETFYYDRVDPTRTPTGVKNVTVPQNTPCFDLKDFLDPLYCAYCFDTISSAVAEAVLPLVYTRYTEYTVRDLRTQFLLQCPDIAGSYTLDMDDIGIDAVGFEDIHGRPVSEDILRSFDLLGYGNYLPVFKDTLDFYINNETPLKYIDPDTEETTTFYSLSEFVEWLVEQLTSLSVDDNYNDFLELLATVNESSTSFFTDLLTHTPWKNVSKKYNAWSILANLKVWSDNLRNTQYDNENYSFWYNLDSMIDGSEGGDIAPLRIWQCLVPHYRLYRRDILTGTYPNAQFGDVAVASLQNPAQLTDELGRPVGLIGSPGSGSRDLLATQTMIAGSAQYKESKFNFSTGVSALAIRQAEALQRYKEKNLRAGSRLTHQQNAFFGDHSKFLQDDYSEFLFSDDREIQINNVIATGESQDINLGDKGAVAQSALNTKSFTFHSHDFGVIIGIAYIMPMAEYENFGVDPQVKKIEKGDYFHPDLQNLGLSPVFSDIVCQFTPRGTFNNPSVLGYSAHDWEYKCALDRVHGEFNAFSGIFGDYVTPRDSKDFASNKLANLYVSPSDIDNIFLQAADFRQSSDQFKVCMFHQIKAVLPMSVTGLPY